MTAALRGESILCGSLQADADRVGYIALPIGPLRVSVTM